MELWDTIFILQLYEWYAMLYIIKTQKDRNIGEIYFDHNNEDIHRTTEDAYQVNYRRKEMRIQRGFNLVLAVVLAGTTCLNVLFHWSDKWTIYFIVIYGSAGILLIFLYMRINYVMKNFHWYEYERTKRAHKGSLIGSLLSLIMWLSFFCFFYSIDDVFNLQKLP